MEKRLESNRGTQHCSGKKSERIINGHKVTVSYCESACHDNLERIQRILLESVSKEIINAARNSQEENF